MTPDEPRSEATSADPAVTPEAGPGTTQGRTRSRMRRVAVQALGVIVSYGLLLTIRSDTFFFFGILGVFGLVISVSLLVIDGLTKPFADRSMPYDGQSSDPSAVVKFHYQTLIKRYCVVAVAIAVFASAPLLVESDYVFPCFGMAVMCAVAGFGVGADQMRWTRHCSRALRVYGFTFRSPVQKLEKRPYGRRFLRVGGVGSRLPKMSARTIVSRDDWPEGIAEGVWFAGDDPFGGVVLVPSTGELMCMQPLDWGALTDERAKAGPQRQEQAKRAGFDKHAM